MPILEEVRLWLDNSFQFDDCVLANAFLGCQWIQPPSDYVDDEMVTSRAVNKTGNKNLCTAVKWKKKKCSLWQDQVASEPFSVFIRKRCSEFYVIALTSSTLFVRMRN